MGSTDSDQFTMTWFYRALASTFDGENDCKNQGQRSIDLGDRFISLWMIKRIYDIRCNLFHSRNDPYDYFGPRDFTLIRLALSILAVMVMEYLLDKDLVKVTYSEDYYSLFDTDVPPPVLNMADLENALQFSF